MHRRADASTAMLCVENSPAISAIFRIDRLRLTKNGGAFFASCTITACLSATAVPRALWLSTRHRV